MATKGLIAKLSGTSYRIVLFIWPLMVFLIFPSREACTLASCLDVYTVSISSPLPTAACVFYPSSCAYECKCFFLLPYLASRSPVNNTEQISNYTFSAVLIGRVLPDKLPMCCLALGDLSFHLMYSWLQAAFCSMTDRHGFIKGSPEP